MRFWSISKFLAEIYLTETRRAIIVQVSVYRTQDEAYVRVAMVVKMRAGDAGG
jgi:hypothetical protein